MASAGADPSRDSADVVAVAARAHEHDRYLASLFAPPAARRPLMVLAAFAGEIGRIPVTVSEPMIGEIRLQWWRDALGAPDPMFKTGHPIADELRTLIRDIPLPVARLQAMIDAQDLALGSDPPPNGAALDARLTALEGSQFALALEAIAGPGAVAQHRELIDNAGLAYGLTRLLVELPAFSAERRTLLPADAMRRHGIALDDVYAGRGGDAIATLVDEIAERAATLATSVLGKLRHVPREQRTPFLPLAAIGPYLRGLGRRGHDPLRNVVEPVPLVRLGRFWWLHRTGRL